MAAHRRSYPEGRKREITQEWLDRVDAVLALNKRDGKSPASRTELLEGIGADKSNMSQIWGTPKKPRSQTSKLVDPISEVLGIDMSTPSSVTVFDQNFVVRRVLDHRDETIRRNLIRFRNEMSLSPIDVLKLTGIDIGPLERGEDLPSLAQLEDLGGAYGHAIGDFSKPDAPRTKPEDAPGFFLRTRPGMLIDAETHAKLQAIIDEANVKMRGGGPGKRGK